MKLFKHLNLFIFFTLHINYKCKKGTSSKHTHASNNSAKNYECKIKIYYTYGHKEMMMGGEWQRVTSRYISKLDFR